MVTLKTVDRLIGLLISGLLLLGSYSWWRATKRARGRHGMMGQMMGTMAGMDPLWYLFGTLTAVSVIVGVYIISREQVADILSSSTAGGVTADGKEGGKPRRNSGALSSGPSEQIESATVEAPSSERPSPLTFLPKDEQRVIEPILKSPGLTQVELRGRSDFSKAKVSQVVNKLEDRGLIYRERQGRTYRIYPGELLKDSDDA